MAEETTRKQDASNGGKLIDTRMKLSQLPLRKWNFKNCPAIPFWADEYGDPDLNHVFGTLKELEVRGGEREFARQGLSTVYTIGGHTAPARDFLFDEKKTVSESVKQAASHLLPTGPLPAPPVATATPDGGHAPETPGEPELTHLPLEKAEQFAIGWTNFGKVWELSQNLLPSLAGSLTNEAKANETFWPALASFGLPFNLLILQKPPTGTVYEIDMRHVGKIETLTLLHTDGTTEVRFAPGTRTVLQQNPTTKALTPVEVEILDKNGAALKYRQKDAAWLYALQAAKTSIAVHGTWLGHVYPWHVVPAAMQMTMYNTLLPEEHRLLPLLLPQSETLIDFDFVLLMFLWGKITPPTPVDGYMPLLQLLDDYAGPRTFFGDDPRAMLKAQRISPPDFKVKQEWDAYPVAGFLIKIWDATEAFVTAVVNELYKTDGEVENDKVLEAWIAASTDVNRGNIKGLELPETRADVIKILTSLLFRVTAHGASSLVSSVNPALSFVATLPPCLQSDVIPKPGTPVSEKELMALLPHTGSIGAVINFFFTFAYTRPFVPFIPSGGVTADTYFPPQLAGCNTALIGYRQQIHKIVDELKSEWNRALTRLRGHEEAVPKYAEDQYLQWARSIEI